MSKKQKTRGKRDGTPEVSGSPANEMFTEDDNQLAEKKAAIIDDEILKLAIKNEDLSRIRENTSPFSSKDGPNVDVIVRKSRPLSEIDRYPPKKVAVAHPAPVDAPLSEFAGAAGPRFDESGIILPHSILGSIENYVEEGARTGELPSDMAQQQLTHVLPIKHGDKEKKSRKPQYPKMESVHESNALKNWQVRMAERRRQQGFLSRLLKKSAESLVMNQADGYRETQEARYLLERAIPKLDYGKGFRDGSEFWKQHEGLGDDIGGVHIQPGQSEKGYPAPVEYIGVPKTILGEKGSKSVRPPSGHKKPWHKTEYLHQRRDQLQPVIRDLASHRPDMGDLEIIGTAKRERITYTPNILDIAAEFAQDAEQENVYEDQLIYDDQQAEEDCLSCYPDVYPEPVFGPSIKFAGQSARWTGDSVQFKDQVGIEARISFEAYEKRRTMSHLEVTNDGTTCIYYSWKKIPQKNPFDIVHAKVQRFYFDNNDGVILPGDTKRFPFVFKSPNAGVFMEQWEFVTHPRVYGGASLLATLRGVSLQEDKLKAARSEIEQELARRQAVQIVSHVINNIISGIQTPERPSSPLDAHITEEEIFAQKNPNLKYHGETVNDLRNLYESLFPAQTTEEGEEKEETPSWDMDIASLKQYILAMDEEDDRKQEFLQKINQMVANLSFPSFSPTQEQMYSVCYHMLTSALDKMVDGCQATRVLLGMPDNQEVAKDLASPSETNMTKRASNAKSVKPDPKEAKEGKETKKGGKKEKEDKLTAKSPSKDNPPKGGKITPSQSQKRPGSKTSNERGGSAGQDKQKPTTTDSPSGPVDSVLQNKYNEKVFVQAYAVLSEFLDQVSDAFAQIENPSDVSTASFAT